MRNNQRPGYELMYGDSGNLMYFLFFTVFDTYPENHVPKINF